LRTDDRRQSRAPAGRPARARPPGRAQRAGTARGQASETTNSATSAPPEAALDPIEGNSATRRSVTQCEEGDGVNLRDVTWRVQSSPVAKAVVRQVLDLRSIWAETAQPLACKFGWSVCCGMSEGVYLEAASVGVHRVRQHGRARLLLAADRNRWPRGRQSQPPADGTFQGVEGWPLGSGRCDHRGLFTPGTAPPPP
jgi:hypothetical protein